MGYGPDAEEAQEVNHLLAHANVPIPTSVIQVLLFAKSQQIVEWFQVRGQLSIRTCCILNMAVPQGT